MMFYIVQQIVNNYISFTVIKTADIKLQVHNEFKGTNSSLVDSFHMEILKTKVLY